MEGKPDAGDSYTLPPGLIAQAEAVALSNPEPPAQNSGRALPITVDGKQGSSVFQKNTGSSRKTASHEGNTSETIGGMPNVTNPFGYLQETPIEDAPPPAYSEIYGLVDMNHEGLNTRANVSSDGRVNINIDQKSTRLSNLLVPALRNQLNLQSIDGPPVPPPGYIPPSLGGLPGQTPPPPMNVVIHVVGSRGDVQPFVALGQVLKKTYGHRVRLATHPTFRGFVEENGLEFFSIGGDPAELMAFMVKNPGLMPGKDALRSGDIGKRRKGMYEIIRRCWRSCFEAGDGTGIEVSDNQTLNPSSGESGILGSDDLASKPFVADAIIANPPSFAHIHCAEKLGIPLHLMFTMPWSPTQAFPHPLANIQSSNADESMTNFISYALVEMMTWQGLGDVINRFREKSLGLEPVSLMWAPGMASRLRIPYTYCWSPALIPKPKDWGSHIFVSGFYFLSLAENYVPAADLAAFLDAGPPPIYIGFGSIVVDDPNAMTSLIFEAVRRAGQRALVSKGWGGFGGDSLTVPEDVFMLGNVPHDWLFKRVSCVVHHGGAGTTAAGIATGRPTVIVPFFGDQPFWGAMVAKAGAGPLPIPNKQLTAANLAEAIIQALSPTTLERAQELGARIESEKGSDLGAKSFHDALNVDKLRCSLAPSRSAVWRVKRTEIRLSAFAAAVLGNEGLLDFNDLKLYRPKEYDSEDGPWEPISGGASALIGTIGSLMMGVADFPVEIFKAFSSKSVVDKKVETLKSSESENPPRATPTPGNSNSASSTALDQLPFSQDASTTSLASSYLSVNSHTTETTDATDVPSVLQQSNDGNASPTSTVQQPQSCIQPPSESIPSPHMSLGAALGAGKGVGRIVSAGLKSPMDFTLGIARGFHNAPKLYGDESVRQTERITGFQSGLKAAGKGFGFGFYDGISGLVTQPLEGAKKEGIAGFLKGFGKGIGGIVLKPGAAIWGIPGYTFKGIYKELQKRTGSSVQNYIIAARTSQGYDEWRDSTREERLDIISQWHASQVKLAQQKKQWRIGQPSSSHGTRKPRNMSFEERKQLAKQKGARSSPLSHRSPSGSASDAHTQPMPSLDGATADDETFENAIQESVSATSRGNAEEDAMIERAIRASVAELRRAAKEDDERNAIQRAIQASVAESNRSGSKPAQDGLQIPSEHDQQLEEALRQSMHEHDGTAEQLHLSHSWDDSGVDTDDDENIKLALENSRRELHPQISQDSELEQAIQDSKDQQQRDSHGARATGEEEIVLEYIKKQSLAEEEHRRKLALKGTTTDQGDDFKRQ